MKKLLILILIIAAVLGGVWYFKNSKPQTSENNAPTPEEKPDYQVSIDAKKDLIVLDSPQPNEVIASPIVITGKARGPWYFEASFPVTLTDWDGLIIAEGHAEAQGDWMTEDFVPFKAMLTFTKPAYGTRGTLILKKDNPSGLPEHDDALEIPVLFSK
jgi:hypothetical protein